SALTYLGGKLVLFLHSSILSDVGASTKPGAVQIASLVIITTKQNGLYFGLILPLRAQESLEKR
ncbi:hypothetical protein C8R21_1021, partial [Nitrosospira multiformis]